MSGIDRPRARVAYLQEFSSAFRVLAPSHRRQNGHSRSYDAQGVFVRRERFYCRYPERYHVGILPLKGESE
jgi:hypothetical protein